MGRWEFQGERELVDKCGEMMSGIFGRLLLTKMIMSRRKIVLTLSRSVFIMLTIFPLSIYLIAQGGKLEIL